MNRPGSNMKIAYLVQMVDLSHENGIAKKIQQQITYWKAQGHTVRLFSLADSPQLWNGLNDIETTITLKSTLWKRFKQSRKLAKELEQWEPQLIYFRFCYYYPPLDILMKKIPTVVEINSDDLKEYKHSLSKFQFYYHILTRDKILENVKHIITVTHELAHNYKNYKKPIDTIANAINLTQITPLDVSQVETPRLVFLGSSGNVWHGVDKLIALASHFPSWHIDIIGYSLSDFKAQGFIPEPNMVFHGYLPEHEYRFLLESAHVAIGSLALHRNQMNEACPIKVREYLAHGLPIIIAYRDSDFLSPTDFILELPNTETTIMDYLSEIEAFVMQWKTKRVNRRVIEHLDVKTKELKRLHIMKQTLQDVSHSE